MFILEEEKQRLNIEINYYLIIAFCGLKWPDIQDMLVYIRDNGRDPGSNLKFQPSFAEEKWPVLLGFAGHTHHFPQTFGTLLRYIQQGNS